MPAVPPTGRTGARRAGMARIVLASASGHARRYAAGALATMLGVAFVATSLMVLASAQAALERAAGGQYERADLVVTGGGLTGATVAAVRQVEGVGEASGIAFGVLRVTYPDTATPRTQSAVSVPDAPALRWQEAVAGRLPERDGEVAVRAAEAQRRGVEPGSALAVTGADGTVHEMTVVGVLGGTALRGAALTVTGTDLARISAGQAGYEEVLVALAPGADRDVAAAAISAAVPAASDGGGETRVVTAAERAAEVLRMHTGGLDLIGALLLGFAGIAVFVAILVVSNTFSILLAQRTRELGLLRCVGASRAQVFRSVLAESLVLGAVASLAGLALAVAAAAGVVALLSRVPLGSVPVDRLEIGAAAVAVPLLVGVATTVVAALPPARRSTRVAPLAALHPELAPPVRSKAGRVRMALAAGCVAAGALPLAAGMRAGDPTRGIPLGLAGGALTFAGVLLAGPLLVPALLRLLGTRPLRRFGGIPGRLALANALRNPHRTAATTSALLIGVTLIVLLNVGAASVERTSQEVLDQEYPLDIAVTSSHGPLAPSIVDGVRRVPAVAATLPVPVVLAGVAGGGQEQIPVAGLDPARVGEILRDRSTLGELADGVALVAAHRADLLAPATGVLTLRAGGRELSLRPVAGPSGPGVPELMVTAADLARLAATPDAGTLWIRLHPDADPRAAVEDLDAVVSGHGGIAVTGGAPERAVLDTILAVMLWIATGLLAVAVGIALVGVGNTLGLSIFERAREHALLRALGLTRGQLRRTLAAEALLVSGLAVLLGTGLGIGYGYAGARALLAAVGDVSVAVPVGRLLLVAAVALTAGLAASVLPARRAARTAPAAGLAGE